MSGTRVRWATVARVAFVAVAAFALWNTLHHAELGRAAAIALGVGPAIALGVLPFLAAMMLQAAGYAQVLRVLGGTRARASGAGARVASFLRTLTVLLSAEAVLMSVPAGAALAETINPYLLQRRLGVPLPEGLAATATKKALIVLTNGLYIGIAVVLGGGFLQGASRALLGRGGLAWIVAASAVVMVVAGLALSRVLFSGSVAARAHGLLRRVPSARFRAFLDDRREGFRETDAHFAGLLAGGLPALAVSGLFMLGCWLVEGAETFVLLRLVGVGMPFAEVLAFEVVVSLLRSLAFMVPAGLGVQDAGYVAFLGAFGVPDAATVGVAFLLLKRAKELFYMALGFTFFAVLGDGPRGGVPVGADPSPGRA